MQRAISASADDVSPVQGSVLFERCFIDRSDYAAYYSRKMAQAYGVSFTDCVFRDVSRLQIPFNNPFFLEVPDYYDSSASLGGYEFHNVFLSYDTDFSFFRVYGWPTLKGLSDISGNFTVAEPNGNGVLSENVADTTDVDFTYNIQPALPSLDVSGEILASTAVECDSTLATYRLARQSTRTDYPFGVAVDTSGSATFGDDLHIVPGGWVIPANELEIERSFTARQDARVEDVETAELYLLESDLYTLESISVLSFNLYDCLLISTDDNLAPSRINVFPNPASTHLYISNEGDPSTITVRIFSANGKLVLE